jgi:hypothetical protein
MIVKLIITLVTFATNPHIASNVEKTIKLQIVPNHHQNPPSVPYVRDRTQPHTKNVQCTLQKT